MRKQETKSFKVEGESGTEECAIMVTALDGSTGSELGVRLLQLFGPGLLGVITAMEANDLPKVIEQAASFFSKLSPAEFTAIRRQLLRGAQAQIGSEFVEVNDAFVSERFAGHVGSVMALMAFALKVNFSGFFDDLGVNAERLKKLTERATKLSGPTTTG